jgi:hypothetical protein
MASSNMNFLLGFDPFAGILQAIGLIALFIAWIAIALTVVLKDGTMDRPSRVAQLYGYTVCLVTVLTILFTLPSIVESLFALGSPLQTERGFEPALSSFDAYVATYERTTPFGRDNTPAPPRPADDQLRRQYEALRLDKIAANRFNASRNLVSKTLLLLLATALLWWHARWLRRTAAAGAAA